MAGRLAGTFDVNVKNFQGGSVVVSVHPTWNVGQVKEEIARKMKVSAQEFKLVFAGQTLADSLTLAVSALGSEKEGKSGGGNGEGGIEIGRKGQGSVCGGVAVSACA